MDKVDKSLLIRYAFLPFNKLITTGTITLVAPPRILAKLRTIPVQPTLVLIHTRSRVVSKDFKPIGASAHASVQRGDALVGAGELRAERGGCDLLLLFLL